MTQALTNTMILQVARRQNYDLVKKEEHIITINKLLPRLRSPSARSRLPLRRWILPTHITHNI